MREYRIKLPRKAVFLNEYKEKRRCLKMAINNHARQCLSVYSFEGIRKQRSEKLRKHLLFSGNV